MSEDKQRTYEAIENFLKGDLEGKELSDFKNKLQSDNDFAKQVEFHQQLEEAITTEPDELNFRQLLKNEGENYLAKNSPKVTRKFSRFWIAAAAIVVVLIGAWLIRSNIFGQSNTRESLFAQHFKPPVILLQDRSTQSSLEKQIEMGYRAYKNKDFAQAATILNQVLSVNQAKMETYYFTAISNLALENGDLQLAINQLDKVIEEGQSRYIYGARWYKALALLKMDNKEGAAKELEILKEKGQGKYRGMAVELLRKIW